MGKFKNNIVVKLLGAIIIGILLGSIVGEGPIQVIATIKHITGQFIFFCVPLVIIGTIASSITNLKANASKMLGAELLIAYLSSIGAAIMSMIAGYALIYSRNSWRSKRNTSTFIPTRHTACNDSYDSFSTSNRTWSNSYMD